MVNRLNIKQKYQKIEPERSGTEGDANRSPVPTLNVKFAIQLKYLTNFWRFVDLPLINCEIQLDLSQAKDCVQREQNNNIRGVNFVITSAELNVAVVTL